MSRPAGRARKRRRSAGRGASAPAPERSTPEGGDPESARPVARAGGDANEEAGGGGLASRSEARNAAARASLEPLAQGERPLPVTVGAVVAFVLAGGNLVAYFAGLEVDGERPSPTFFAFPVLLLVAAWGMWRVRYWAVLGMQAILALVLIGFSLNLMFAATSDDLLVAGVSLLVIAGAGTLFWSMVRAMARIQMPERR